MTLGTPTLHECKLYASILGMPVEQGEAFFDHFTSNGWRVSGRAPMKDWKAALRNWKRNYDERKISGRALAPNPRNTHVAAPANGNSFADLATRKLQRQNDARH
jgi:hypothetical protein